MVDGLIKVAPVGIMIAFAILYFGLMLDVGLFDPLVKKLIRLVKGDPVKVAVGTAVPTTLVALDGDGATTFMITCSAMGPIYKRLNMKPLVLSGIICLAAGTMNIIPWGGPDSPSYGFFKCRFRRDLQPGVTGDDCRDGVRLFRRLSFRKERAESSKIGGWGAERHSH